MKIKKKLWPKQTPTISIAKRNHRGRLKSSPKELMLTLHKEYQDRLRPRKCKEDIKEHMNNMHEVKPMKLRLF